MNLPVVPKLGDFRLEEFLNALRSFALGLDKIITEGDAPDNGGGGQLGSGESFADVAETSVASGSTSVGWTSIDVGTYVSGNASHVLIREWGRVGENGDQLTIEYGTDGSTVAKTGVETATIQGDSDTDSQCVERRIPITEGKQFYYRATFASAGATSAYDIRIIGYYTPN